MSENKTNTAAEKSAENVSPASGVIIINKPAGITSHRVISACRRMFGTRQVGHAGTLDPMARGVLPVFIGRAVKASDYVMAHDKEYLAEMKLGLTTDTEDITGETLTSCGDIPSEEAVLDACASFVGKIMQTPPMYSAIKVGGRKLVDIARDGGEIEREAREVMIYSLSAEKLDEVTYSLRVHCSKGTYIRTLCADIGKKLGCGAVMSSLVRTRTGEFTLADSVTLEDLDALTPAERKKRLIPVEKLFMRFPALELPDYFAKLCRAGVKIYQKKVKANIPDGEAVRLKNRGVFFALGRGETVDGIPVIAPEKLFVLEPIVNEMKRDSENEEKCAESAEAAENEKESESKMKDSVLIDCPFIDQREKYPTGCESVSSVMLLNFLGFGVTPEYFIDNCLPRASEPYRDGDVWYGADPDRFYLGDPYTTGGWGCFAECVADGINKYLDAHENENTAHLRAYPIHGEDLFTLLDKHVKEGRPVIVFATMGMVRAHPSLTWRLDDGSGREYTWKTPMHCLLLVGFDSESGEFIFNDPLEAKNKRYKTEDCLLAHEDMGLCAAVVM